MRYEGSNVDFLRFHSIYQIQSKSIFLFAAVVHRFSACTRATITCRLFSKSVNVQIKSDDLAKVSFVTSIGLSNLEMTKVKIILNKSMYHYNFSGD